MSDKYRIIFNLEDHVGYEGELVMIKESLPDNYFIVKNEKGKEWQVGIEEIMKQENEYKYFEIQGQENTFYEKIGIWQTPPFDSKEITEKEYNFHVKRKRSKN